MTPRVDLVLFDVNETLADLAPVDAALVAAGAPAGSAPRWLACVLRDGIALTAAGASVPFAGLAEAAAAEVGAPGAAVVDAVGAMPPVADVAPALERLRSAGVRAATLTNGSASTAAAVLDRAGAAELVEANLSAPELGAWKPAAGAYRSACSALGAAPERTALVAVHPWDVDGAARAGLVGAWVDRGSRPYPAVMTPPAVSAPSLVEVVTELV